MLPAHSKGLIMSSDDTSYYRKRARSERQRAKTCRAEIAEIHEELARLYDALIEHQSLRPTLHIFTRDVA